MVCFQFPIIPSPYIHSLLLFQSTFFGDPRTFSTRMQPLQRGNVQFNGGEIHSNTLTHSVMVNVNEVRQMSLEF